MAINISNVQSSLSQNELRNLKASVNCSGQSNLFTILKTIKNLKKLSIIQR